ncbi:MAG: FAD-binding oxidoreductase [Pseudomonadota bacterium]
MKPEPVTDHAPSLWAETAPDAPRTEPLTTDIDTDIVIIGGGFTGLSCALHSAEAGRSVVLLEAREIGFGASGRNNGQVIPALTRPDPDDLVARFGADGERFVALLGGAAQLLFDLVREHGIECEAEQNGWIQPAHSPGRMAIAERRVAQWSRRGMDVDLIDKDTMHQLLGSDAWHGGWTARTGGTVNPLALARGMTAAAIKAGAKVFTQSPALSTRHNGTRWIVETKNGCVSAGGLLIATNAYTDEINTNLKHEIVPVLSWQMATTPITDNVRKTVLSGRQAVSDTRGDLRFFRYDRTGRLITGGALIIGAGAVPRLKTLVGQRLRTAFPQLGEFGFTHVWNGHIGMTTDYTPRFHDIGPDGYAWAGCNGRGVALAVAVGREFARALSGLPKVDLALPFTDIEPIPFQPLLRHLAPLNLNTYRWRDSRELLES